MSADYPPPQPPGAGQNPYAQQPPQPPAPGQNPYAQQPPQPPAPGQNPYAQQPPQPPAPGRNPYGPQTPYGEPQQPAPFDAAAYPPPAPPAPVRNNAGLGILAGLAAAVVAALLYGLLIRGTKHEISYAALGVGVLVGFALAKVGGRNPVLPIAGIPLALFGVYLGQLYGIALLVSHDYHIGVVDIFTHHFHDLQQTWKDSMGAKDFLFFGIAGLEGFLVPRRMAG
jgi:hypothetical protein